MKYICIYNEIRNRCTKKAIKQTTPVEEVASNTRKPSDTCAIVYIIIHSLHNTRLFKSNSLDTTTRTVQVIWKMSVPYKLMIRHCPGHSCPNHITMNLWHYIQYRVFSSGHSSRYKRTRRCLTSNGNRCLQHDKKHPPHRNQVRKTIRVQLIQCSREHCLLKYLTDNAEDFCYKVVYFVFNRAYVDNIRKKYLLHVFTFYMYLLVFFWQNLFQWHSSYWFYGFFRITAHS